jgi:hypothetical protein
MSWHSPHRRTRWWRRRARWHVRRGRSGTTTRRSAARGGTVRPRRATSTRRLRHWIAAHPELEYIETRDCDDELGSTSFLREVVGQLLGDVRLAYVQTIKESQVSAGDPFNNREAMFYRGQMLARNAANATFPCGSGVVWRRAALEDIGLFPTWNLVEDLQSGSRRCVAAGIAATCRSWERWDSTRQRMCRTFTSSGAHGRSTPCG